MRDIARIPRTLEILEHYWLRVPDWRLGQLIENVKLFSGKEDLFFIEDDELIQLFENFFRDLYWKLSQVSSNEKVD